VDGTHTPCVLYPTRGEKSKAHYSFKLCAPGLNTQVGILMNGTFAFISNSGPASTDCDINQIRNSNLPNLLTRRDCVMLDGVYQGMPFASCIPYRQH
jgi:hypothetical protein